NVQGDEPELSGETIDLAIQLLEDNPAAPMATLATPIRSREQLNDPACVKVVMAKGSGLFSGQRSPSPRAFWPEKSPDPFRALYFSRAAIPHAREWDDRLLFA